MLRQIAEQTVQISTTFEHTTQALHAAIHGARRAILAANHAEASAVQEADEHATLAMGGAVEALENSMTMISTISATLAAMDTARIVATSAMKEQTTPTGGMTSPLPRIILLDPAQSTDEYMIEPGSSNHLAEQKELRIEYAVEQIYTKLFDLLWSRVPLQYRCRGFPSQPPWPAWTRVNLQRWIVNTRIMNDELISWSELHHRYLNIDKFIRPSRGFAYHADYLAWKAYLADEHHAFHEQLRRRFNEIPMLPPIYSNSSLWRKFKTGRRALLLVENRLIP
ncbi:hypothetical protein SYNPS1DRAFT_21200 [Syncephalis pseudoplumigaleata]|uniref:Uncharacterized protein n=1 Tax=Syncephalis pseudoplumigaleata TaxID=1712513 RepID=A0A4P9Z567_9FUNG|nr:hypothetical protein SYNPS1DRAFT_21200 [Syncephalis pseudoplumigaleata]|eukprot:RKP27222.1 hypothetical protein SYNPS1DRAFT_21200 [Syncephalis pseudoplumigaleata]